MTKKWLKNDKKMTPQNRNDKKCKTKWQKNEKMTKINNQQPSEFAGKIFITLETIDFCWVPPWLWETPYLTDQKEEKKCAINQQLWGHGPTYGDLMTKDQVSTCNWGPQHALGGHGLQWHEWSQFGQKTGCILFAHQERQIYWNNRSGQKSFGLPKPEFLLCPRESSASVCIHLDDRAPTWKKTGNISQSNNIQKVCLEIIKSYLFI